MANDTAGSSRSCNITYNPFDASSIDSLHLPSFSPSVFASKKKSCQSSSKKKPFRWSIDQLATLYPADIDELPQQEEILDEENESKVQEAIDKFFSQENIAPSPWSQPKTKKIVSFSPKPPEVCECSDCNGYSPDQDDASPDGGQVEEEMKIDVSCQTTVTIPMNFDFEALFAGKLEPYKEDIDLDPDEDIQSSSLRRKLFSHSDTNSSPMCATPSPIMHPSLLDLRMERSRDLQLSPLLPTLSPIVKDDHRERKPQTPESVDSQFSSSPITTAGSSRYLTPCTPRDPSPLLCNGKLPALSPICKHQDTPKSGKLDYKPSGSLRIKLDDSFKKELGPQQVPDQAPIEELTSNDQSVKTSGFFQESYPDRDEESRSTEGDMSICNEPLNNSAPLAESSILFGDLDCNSAAYKLTSTMRCEAPVSDLTFDLTMNDANLTAMETSSLLLAMSDQPSGAAFPLTSTQRSMQRDPNSLFNYDGHSELKGLSQVTGQSHVKCQRSGMLDQGARDDEGYRNVISGELTYGRPESGYSTKSGPSMSVSGSPRSNSSTGS